MDNLAILIPAYNEAATIQKVVRDIKLATNKIEKVAIYVYDNNSSDDTARLAEEAGAIVRHEYVQGKGAVIRRMFRDVDANAYVMIDADDTYPAEVIPDMYRLILEKRTDMVVGDRLSSTYFEENKRLFHNSGNAIVRKLINLLFRTDIKDILTGYRAFSYQFVKTFPVLSKGFEIETEMSIHSAESKMYVENLVIDYRDRPTGSESKLNTVSDGIKVIGTVAKLYRVYHPMAFFGSVATVLAILSFAFFIARVWLPYLHTGLVDNMPTLVVTMIGLLTAIVSVFTGLILSAIQSNEKQGFEFELIRASDKLKALKERS